MIRFHLLLGNQSAIIRLVLRTVICTVLHLSGHTQFTSDTLKSADVQTLCSYSANSHARRYVYLLYQCREEM